MKRLCVLIGAILLGIIYNAKADEGAWLPLLVERLNYVDMQKMGLNLTAEEIYSINHGSLKDAIVSINKGWCTGSVISQEGLVISSHRGIFNAIQKYTTSEKDYIENGFWAKNRDEELRCEGFTATFLVRMENVTDKIVSNLKDNMSEADRNAKISETSKTITDEALKGTTYEAEVKSFFEGNEFYLFVYQTYTDVRLVGIPSYHVGYYGGDKDNWSWPKYTGDFALLRVYMSPKEEPAAYNKKNIPLKSKYSIPLSLKGYKQNDFVMGLGYGYKNTDRFITSSGISMITDQVNPAIVKIRNEKLAVIKRFMDADNEVKIQYASKYKESSNYRKYYEEQSDNLKRFDQFNKNKKMETDFHIWADSEPRRKERYGGTLKLIADSYEEVKKYNLSKYYYNEAVLQGPEILSFAYQFDELAKALKSGVTDQAQIDILTAPLKYSANKFFKNFSVTVDKEIFISLLKMYYMDIPADQQPLVLQDIDKKYKGNFAKFADDVYSKSIFSQKDKTLEFLTAPAYKNIENDAAYKVFRSFYENNQHIMELAKPATMELAKGYRIFTEGLMKYYSDIKFYPSTNNTMRLTYGKVTDYTDAKDQKFNYFTTLDQMLTKENAQDPDYTIPAKIKEAFAKQDFGKYAQDGKIVVCFISDNDVCGGYSGSPVINGKGQLIGIDCDLNREGTIGEYDYEPQYTRAVNVDVRFVLYMIDKCEGASYLLQEMKIAEN